MKKLLSFLFVSVLVSLARGGTHDLGKHGKFVLNVPKGWIETGNASKINGLDAYGFKISPTNGNTTVCYIDVIFGGPEKKTKKDTEAEVRAAAEGYLSQHKNEVAEKSVVLKEYKLKAGWGFYSTVTAAVPDNPPVKGQNNSLSCGMIDLPDGVRLSIVIGSDDLADVHYQQALDIVQSAILQPKWAHLDTAPII